MDLIQYPKSPVFITQQDQYAQAMNESHSIKVVLPVTRKNPENRKPDPVNAKDRQGKPP